jgi:hypothetical protein
VPATLDSNRDHYARRRALAREAGAMVSRRMPLSDSQTTQDSFCGVSTLYPRPRRKALAPDVVLGHSSPAACARCAHWRLAERLDRLLDPVE